MQTKIILASLLALLAYAYTGKKMEVASLEELVVYQGISSEQGTTTLLQETERNIMAYNRWMEEDSKASYRSLTPVVDRFAEAVNQIRILQENCQKRIGSQKLSSEKRRTYLLEFMDETQMLLHECYVIAEYYLRGHADLFGLKDNEVDIRVKHIFEELHIAGWREIEQKLWDNKIDALPGLLSSLELEVSVGHAKVIDMLTNMTTGRGCYWDVPINFYLLKVGKRPRDTVTIMVQFSGFDAETSPPNVKLKINEKPIPFDENGIVFHHVKREGNDEIKIEYWIRNPLTGITFRDSLICNLNSENLKPVL